MIASMLQRRWTRFIASLLGCGNVVLVFDRRSVNDTRLKFAMDDETTQKISASAPKDEAQQSENGRQYADQPTRPLPPPNKGERRKTRRGRTILTILLLLVLALAGVFATGYYYFMTTISAPITQFIRPVARGKDEPVINTTPVYDTIKGRSWNILLLGSDNDQKYTFPAVLTQVMMVIHVDTDQNSVYMVSIPRDSWVSVPGDGMHKIDQAFLLGVNQNNTFEGGVQLARTTIEKDYGITIDRYAWVGLSGFAKVIDTLGGVDIDVTHPIVDDAYPDDTGKGAATNDPFAFKRLYLPPGPQHLTGEQALEYVRSRHADLVGDIGRTQRQQQVLTALKQKLTVASILNNLPGLIKDLTGQVYTDLSQDEMIAFANFGRVLTSQSIQRITLGPGPADQNFGNYASVYDPLIGANQDVVIPNCAAIQPFINRVFELNDAQSCNVTG